MNICHVGWNGTFFKNTGLKNQPTANIKLNK